MSNPKPTSQQIYDLIYLDKSVFDEIQAQYPDAVYEDGRDEVHPNRFVVKINGIDRLDKEWNRFLLNSGIWEASFNFQLALQDNETEFHDLIKEIMAEDHPEGAKNGEDKERSTDS